MRRAGARPGRGERQGILPSWQCLVSSRRPPRALPAIARLMALAPRRCRGLLHTSAWRWRTGQCRPGDCQLSKALSLKPDHAESIATWAGAGELLACGAGVAPLREALEIRPDHALAYSNNCFCLPITPDGALKYLELARAGNARPQRCRQGGGARQGIAQPGPGRPAPKIGYVSGIFAGMRSAISSRGFSPSRPAGAVGALRPLPYTNRLRRRVTRRLRCS